MKFEIDKMPGVTKVVLSGRMCFSDHALFRGVLKAFEMPAGETVVFDMAGLELIDSAGLGMLIIARDEAKKKSLDFVLENPRSEVKRLMDMAKFDRFFTIRP